MIIAWSAELQLVNVLYIISSFSHTKFSLLTNLHNLITARLHHNTRSSSKVTFAGPPRTDSGEEPVILWNNLSPHHKCLFSVRCTRIWRALPDTVSFTLTSSRSPQFIICIITILFYSHYFSLLVFEGLVHRRILFFIDLFLSQRTDSTDSQSPTI